MPVKNGVAQGVFPKRHQIIPHCHIPKHFSHTQVCDSVTKYNPQNTNLSLVKMPQAS